MCETACKRHVTTAWCQFELQGATVHGNKSSAASAWRWVMLHLQSAQLAGLCFNEPSRLVVSVATTHQAARIDNGFRSASCVS